VGTAPRPDQRVPAPPPKPKKPPPPRVDSIPAELRERPQWIVWRYEERGGKPTKVLYDPIRRKSRAKANDPLTWASFDEALAAFNAGGFDGIGFVFSEDDPYFGADLDHCLHDGEVLAWAAPIVAKLPTFGEVSPSGTGIKFIGRGKIPPELKKKFKVETGTNRRGMGPDGTGALEVYDCRRYFTVTGNVFNGQTAIADLPGVAAELFLLAKDKPPSASSGSRRRPPKSPPAGDAAPTLPDPPSQCHSDDDVLRVAGETDMAFNDLWDGRISSFPSPSEADMSLCNRLVCFCGPGQHVQVRRLFLQSGLSKRGKIQVRADYLDRTIAKAYEGRTEFYEWSPSANGHASSVRSVRSVRESAPWDEIKPERTIDPVPFPIEVFPELVQEYCRAVAESIGCQVDFPGSAVLGAASAAIGRSVSVLLKPGYFGSASLWIAMVGPVSDGKTPTIDLVMRPIRDIDAEMNRRFEEEMSAWEDEKAQAKKEKRTEPKKPVRERLDVDDITIEALNRVLCENPRGVGWICDELSGCIQGLNQYKAGGKGNDRPTLMKIYSGKPIKRDRKDEHSRTDFSYLTILGGMVPDFMVDLKDSRGRIDGFLERYLVSIPDPLPIPEWSETGVEEQLAQKWAKIVRTLVAVPMAEKDGAFYPQVVCFEEDAKAEFVRLYNVHVAEMNHPDFDQSLRGAWGKFRETAARLSLVVASIRRAVCVLTGHYDSQRFLTIKLIDITSAWKLVAYFKNGFLRGKAVVEGHSGVVGENARLILGWIQAQGLTEFPERDVYQAINRFRFEREAMKEALKSLHGRNLIRPLPVDRKPTGQPPSPRWEVNPKVHDPAQNAQNAQNPS
jgi:hypothetical protein